MDDAQDGRLRMLLEWASMRLARNRVPNAYDNAVYSIANALSDGSVSDANRDGAIDLLEELIDLDRPDVANARFIPLRYRLEHVRGHRSLPPAGYLLGQGVNAPPTWKGAPFYKSVWDMALYNELLWELRPGAIVELGSGEGASADWFATISGAFGLDVEIVSFDVAPPVARADYPITFVRAAFPDDIDRVTSWMETLDPAVPWLVVEDMHVGIEMVLPALVSKLRPGDYLVVEDSAHKQSALERLAGGSIALEVDQRYTDRFGLNGTSAMNSILRVAG